MRIVERTKENDPSGFWAPIPFVMAFDDYHEISETADMLNLVKDPKRGFKIKCEEIGFRDGQYYGIFYLRKKDPGYRELVKKWSGPEVDPA